MKFLFIQIFFFLFQFQINIELNQDINTKSNREESYKKEQKSELIILTDNNFNSFVNYGKNNRWLILFYSKTCYYCDRALQVLDNILYKNQFKIVNNIKFGKIDVSENYKIHFRFNITQIPQIILIENNSMIELDLYPNEKNLLNFIESNFSNSLNIITVPKNNLLKYYYISLENSISFFVDKFNDLLFYFNIKYTINSNLFIIIYIIFCAIFWTIIIKGYMRFCNRKKKEDSNNNINKIDLNKNNTINTNKNETNNNLNEKKYTRKRRKHKHN